MTVDDFIEQTGLSFEFAHVPGKVSDVKVSREGRVANIPLMLSEGNTFTGAGFLEKLQKGFRNLEDVERHEDGTRGEVAESKAAVEALPPHGRAALVAARDSFREMLGAGDYRTLIDDVQ